MRVHLLSVAALTVLIVHLRIHSSLKRDCGKNRGFEVDQIAVSLNEQCVVCQATESTQRHRMLHSLRKDNFTPLDYGSGFLEQMKEKIHGLK